MELAAALAALVVVSAVALWVAARVMSAANAQGSRARLLQLIALFAPGIASAGEDPRALLTWQPLAATARRLFPDEFAALDRASGATFPFSADQIEAAHARWTSEWLAWERAHDAEYKLKAAAAEEALGAAGGSPVGRARIDAVEREKLERYQRRYEDYTRVSKALRALATRG